MKKPILVTSAMEDVELDYLKENLNNLKTLKNNICTFYEGEFLENRIVLVATNIGIINSTAATTLGIEKYNPDVIINEGTAGGYGKSVHRGDIVIGTNAVNITTMETEKRGEGEGSDLSKYELTTFLRGEENRLVYKKGDSHLIELAKNIEYKEGNIHFGTIGSGDIWNKEADRILHLNERYEIICEDMEAISVYTIANLYNIPVIGIKAISNNEVLNEEYERKTGINSQKFTLDLIKKILTK